MVRLLAKIRPHDFGIADDVFGLAVGNLFATHQDDEPLRKAHHRTHVAAGVSKAADDAAALAEALQNEPDVETALKRFEAARLSENFRIIERARHLGAYLQASRTQEEQARAGQHSNDTAVIAETAVLDFLYA